MSRRETIDDNHMARAMSAAGDVLPPAVSPNPRVGCVIAKGARVIATGAHKRFGGPHAEAAALARAGARAKGATAYVTMEPCAPFPGKKTPSCARALAAAGIARVVIGSLDPNPKVTGRGAAILRRAGIRTELARQDVRACAEMLNRGFFSRMRRGRPWIILKTALSLDGKAAAASGKSRWVTGKKARLAVHELRANVDAILVGAGTVLADDPALTAHGAGRNPLRVILAGRRRLPKRARVFDGSAPTRVYKARTTAALRAAMKDLARRGIGTVLVEGGPTVHASFLRAGLVDFVKVYLAYKFLSGADDPNTAPRLENPWIEAVGEDVCIEGRL